VTEEKEEGDSKYDCQRKRYIIDLPRRMQTATMNSL
jgi:hypothetical protein